MLKIQPETRRSMLRAWGLTFAIWSIMTGPMLWREHAIGMLVASLATIPALFALFPLVVDMNRIRQARHAEDRVAWRAAYKASSASHCLHLNNE